MTCGVCGKNVDMKSDRFEKIPVLICDDCWQVHRMTSSQIISVCLGCGSHIGFVLADPDIEHMSPEPEDRIALTNRCPVCSPGQDTGETTRSYLYNPDIHDYIMEQLKNDKNAIHPGLGPCLN